MGMADVHPVPVAGGDGLAFLSDDDGQRFEVWTVCDGTLYQISTYPAFADRLGQALATWTFHP